MVCRCLPDLPQRAVFGLEAGDPGLPGRRVGPPGPLSLQRLPGQPSATRERCVSGRRDKDRLGAGPGVSHMPSDQGKRDTHRLCGTIRHGPARTPKAGVAGSNPAGGTENHQVRGPVVRVGDRASILQHIYGTHGVRAEHPPHHAGYAHTATHLPPLCFSRSCKRAAGLRAWHDFCPLSNG